MGGGPGPSLPAPPPPAALVEWYLHGYVNVPPPLLGDRGEYLGLPPWVLCSTVGADWRRGRPLRVRML
jgi:hypothetical protein